jgi:hypothetical protein
MNRYEPKYARCYCVAIAGAAVAVAGTAATVYSTSQQAKAADSAEAQLNNASSTDKYGRRVEPVPYNDRINSDENYMNSIGEDVTDMYQGSLPDIFDIANKVDTQTRNQRNKLSPDFYGTLRQEGKNIAALEKGMIPEDVIASINRVVGENLAGAVDPSAPNGGFAMSATASDTARRLGLTSLDLMKTGMQLGPNWRTNADSFLYTPEDAIKGIFQPGMNTALQSANLQLQRDTNEYISDNNIENAAAVADPSVRGGVNDTLQMGAIQAQQTQNQADALIGLVNSGVNLYGAVKPKQTTAPSAGAGSSWKYNASGNNSAYRGR